MNRSIVLTVAVAALGLAACTSTPSPDAAPTTSSSGGTPPVSVETEVVTDTVTKPVAPPAQPVISSFGYGDLKLGMTRQQALDAKLIGPSTDPAGGCTSHPLLGTNRSVWVSPTLGVSTIGFTAAMTSDGAGVGATEAKLKAEYSNLVPAGPNYSYTAEADGNPKATFMFRVEQGKVTEALISLKGQDCHN
ncbi:hypothetical protein [Lentzea sp. NBRC 102530]|uniref:hypothetical protein n=1 Tax=Lentzea sp. NBRC 102530 TaxID=3032201 RepID=UPI0024A02B5E|nr:hypothetical protein [Lentzea sp. NBRC 102530]GLY48129.1 hypothetical protein Lesp01_17850 [Lentzea sp. NBRC 102530]